MVDNASRKYVSQKRKHKIIVTMVLVTASCLIAHIKVFGENIQKYPDFLKRAMKE